MPTDNSLTTGKEPLKWGRIFLSGVLSVFISLGLWLLAALFLDYFGDTDIGDLLNYAIYLFFGFIPTVVVVASLLTYMMVRHRRVAHSILASIISILFVVAASLIGGLFSPAA